MTETECSTTTSTECHDYEDVDCEIEEKEICIKADATTCVDTEFAASSAIGAGSGDGEQCRSIDTQRCSQPIPEQVCANINQVGGRRFFLCEVIFFLGGVQSRDSQSLQNCCVCRINRGMR